MADDNVLARAQVVVNANTVPFDTAMELLDRKARKEIRKSMEAIQQEMAKVKLEIGVQRNIAGNQQEVRTLIDYYNKLSASLGAVKVAAVQQAASVSVMNKSLNQAGRATGNAAYKMQVFAQTIDDLQYVPQQGLRPILNNIVQINPVLGVMAIAVSTVYDNWGRIAQLWGQHHAKTAAEEMRELAEMINKSAAETERLTRMTERQRIVESQRTAKSATVTAQQSEAHQAIADAGPAVDRAIRDKMAGRFANAVPQNLLDERNAAQNSLNKPDLRHRGADATKGIFTEAQRLERLNKANEAIAGAQAGMLDEFKAALESDPMKLKEFIKALEKDPLKLAQFGPENVEKLKKSSRDKDKREQDTDDEAFRISEEQWKKRKDEDEERIRQEKTDNYVQGAKKQFGMGVLANIALGIPEDAAKASLQRHVEGSMRKTGINEEAIKANAGNIAGQVWLELKGEVGDKARAEGTTEAQSAKLLAAKTATETAPRGPGGFTGFGDFYKGLQASQDRKDPLAEATAKNTAEVAKSNQMIYQAIVAGQKKGMGLAGPP